MKFRSMWHKTPTRGRGYDSKSVTELDMFPCLREQIDSFFATGAKLKASMALPYDFKNAEEIDFSDVASLLRSRKDPAITSAIAANIEARLMEKIDVTVKKLVQKNAFERQQKEIERQQKEIEQRRATEDATRNAAE